MCVGIAYFVIAVIVPLALLARGGERGGWTNKGVLWSMLAGTAGALGALGVILALGAGLDSGWLPTLVAIGGVCVYSGYLLSTRALRGTSATVLATYQMGGALLFGLVAVVCLWGWAALGAGAARLLAKPGALRWFNRAVAALLVLFASDALAQAAKQGDRERETIRRLQQQLQKAQQDAAAANNPAFGIAFGMWDTDTSDFAYIDDVLVTADAHTLSVDIRYHLIASQVPGNLVLPFARGTA
jgi:hypothetical protein